MFLSLLDFADAADLTAPEALLAAFDAGYTIDAIGYGFGLSIGRAMAVVAVDAAAVRMTLA